MIATPSRRFSRLLSYPIQLVALTITLVLAGCETNPTTPTPGLTGPNLVSASTLKDGRELKFVDAPPFDSQLARSLRGSEKAVEISFYDEVSPSQLPPRLQKWLGSVEKNGGQVLVEPPPNEPVPRSPAMLFGLVGSLFNTIKRAREALAEKLFDSADGRDAVLLLKRNGKGEVVVEKIVFRRR